jgi:hypothetical protein
MWKLMNEIIGKNNNKLDSLEYINIDGIRNYNKKQIADGFSDFFSNIGPTLAENIKKPNKNFK